MRQRKEIHQKIYQTIKLIQQQQAEMQQIRQQLNHEIMFNLKDTYLTISNHQSSINIKDLAQFMEIESQFHVLQKFVKWNNHNSSLNLTFAQFSALIISKDDKLLAKIVLERQEMGAIPNFILNLIKKVIQKQIYIHQFCLNCQLQDEQCKDWIDSVVDQNGDLDQSLLRYFLKNNQQSDSEFSSSYSDCLFVRYLQASGNITAERLFSLWIPNKQYIYVENQSKLNKFSTKSYLPQRSIFSPIKQTLRSQFYDCLNRPTSVDGNQVRQSKSIQKHIQRMGSNIQLKIKQKFENQKIKSNKSAKKLLIMLKKILIIENQTQMFRIQLKLCPDFYPILFYDSIPKSRNKKIEASYFRDYLLSFGYNIELNNVYLLFNVYKISKGMSFNDFCVMFDVADESYNLLQKNRFVETLQDIDLSTKKHYFQLLISIIQNQIKINQIKAKFYLKHSNISKYLAFIFQPYNNQINQLEFRQIYRSFLGLDLKNSQCKLIWKRCGLNLKFDEYLNVELLKRQLLPMNLMSLRKN